LFHFTRLSSIAVALLCLLAVPSLGIAQAAAQDEDLPADDIIEILQQNPDLLAEAKAQIVAQLPDRGYPGNERSTTDDRLFSEIRTDHRPRHAMSDERKGRGFGPDQSVESQAQPQPTPPAGTGATKPATGAQAGGNAPAPPALQTRPRETQRKPRATSQDQYPFRDLPALRDLYKQSVADQRELDAFGAALFRNSAPVAHGKAPIDVPVGPDYVIGPGDELVVEYWGASSQRLQLTVDREGRVLLPDAGVVVAAGRTLAEAQREISRLLTRQLRNIVVDVTLGKLRSVRAYVVGDVKNPGAYDISALSTCLSALITAGGPTETGSYRTVKHYRGSKLMEEVDLYDLMLKGVSTAQVHIASGDSILVPPAGPQVTVAGAVRRPAIYELRSEKSLDEVLALAGGVPVSGQLSSLKLERIEAHHRKEMLNVNLPSGDTLGDDAFKRVQIKDGDTITVAPILPVSNRAVYLSGHVFRPGKYPFTEGEKVTDLVRSFDDLLPEAADRAEIVRLHPPDFSPQVIGFSLSDVLGKKAAAPALQPFDTVRVFGRYETDAPKVSIYGAVLRPGEYPLSERMSAADLLRLAGGFKRDAYQEKGDLTSYSIIDGSRVELEHRSIPIGRALAGDQDTDVILKPGDVLTIAQMGGWNDIGGNITVNGEVLHPGRYGIQRGERLSSILRRAGGYTSEAYPYGAILERAQVREFSAKSREEMVAKLQEQSASGGGR